MTRAELRKLSRKDLAKILTEITQENERLRLDLEQAQLELDDRSTGLSDPGDMAQAGQTNWPVPLMAAAGMLLFTAGWLLRSKERRENCDA